MIIRKHSVISGSVQFSDRLNYTCAKRTETELAMKEDTGSWSVHSKHMFKLQH